MAEGGQARWPVGWAATARLSAHTGLASPSDLIPAGAGEEKRKRGGGKEGWGERGERPGLEEADCPPLVLVSRTVRVWLLGAEPASRGVDPGTRDPVSSLPQLGDPAQVATSLSLRSVLWLVFHNWLSKKVGVGAPMGGVCQLV